MDHRGLETRRTSQNRNTRQVTQTFATLAGLTRGTRRSPFARCVGAGLIVALALTAGGCTRKTTLMQEGDEAVGAVSPDSLASLLRDVAQAWEAQTDDAHAASLTGLAVYQDLLRHAPAEWRGRAEELLDSLGVGVETAGGPCGMIVNMFVRSDPSRGSWPAFYWCDASGVRWQEIEGKGMGLVAMTTRAAGDSAAAGAPTQAAALFTRAKGSRQEPLLYAWTRRPKDSRWKIVQTLGPDSLGGFGTGTFATTDSSIHLIARTYRTPRGWEECNACPHLDREHRFRWGTSGFERVEDRDVPSTYSTFVHFIEELMAADPAASLRVTDPALIDMAIQLEWNRSKGTWRISPATQSRGADLTFLRGSQEAFRVTFAPNGENWLITSIQPVSRSLE